MHYKNQQKDLDCIVGMHDMMKDSVLRQTCTCAKVSILESQPQVKVLFHYEFGSVLTKAFLVIKYPQS